MKANSFRRASLAFLGLILPLALALVWLQLSPSDASLNEGKAVVKAGTAREGSSTMDQAQIFENPFAATQPVVTANGGRVAVSTSVNTAASEADRRAANAVRDAYGKLPLQFEANTGQTDPRVKFLSRGRGYGLFLTSNQAVLALRKAAKAKPDASSPAPKAGAALARCAEDKQDTSSVVVSTRLVGANRNAHPSGRDELSGKLNYFLGNDPAKWRTNVPTYSRISYRNVYRGVDLVYHGDQGHLEYDFRLAPGINPKKIRLAFKGADRIEVDQTGDLVLTVGAEELHERKPVAYQEVSSLSFSKN